jgi:DNA ligase-1
MTLIKPFRPMLATLLPPPDEYQLVFPMMGSPKIDGFRCVATRGAPLSRTATMFENLYLQAKFREEEFLMDGLDGELCVGDPWAKNLIGKTAAVNTILGEPNFTFWVFDHAHYPEASFAFRNRQAELACESLPKWVRYLEQKLIWSYEELSDYETQCLKLGYEGIILREPASRYKQGRATKREGTMFKVKRYKDAEAVIIGYHELMSNTNEATIDARGYTKRSSHQENMVPMGTLGAWECRGLGGQFAGKEFKVGGGMSAAQRAEFWISRESYRGTPLKFKYFDYGILELPRHAIFIDFRPKFDIILDEEEDHPF